MLKGLGAEVGTAENWGKRRLTYDIRKQREGTYAVIPCSAEPATVKEFERQLKLNEQRPPLLDDARAGAQAGQRTAPKLEAAVPEEVV